MTEGFQKIACIIYVSKQ